ncbi:hypothetical protein M231_00809 [Tremella mesenterica]|uniref:ATP synthase F(0) complex subunit e, mitochondrial n=1 Tax=Tremella mesenterica TaxID=5217 RepID=A0A4Q1BUU2_TREME|nr:hypothetical protein M231_00809 [Tremella mesenterica]
MASPTVTVVRYSAIFTGIIYGIVHQRTLQRQYDEQKARKAYAAKKAAEKGGASSRQSIFQALFDTSDHAAMLPKTKADGLTVITDPDDPRFDLEKLVESWTKES